MGMERGPGAERGLACPSATWKAAVNPAGQRQMLLHLEDRAVSL